MILSFFELSRFIYIFWVFWLLLFVSGVDPSSVLGPESAYECLAIVNMGCDSMIVGDFRHWELTRNEFLHLGFLAWAIEFIPKNQANLLYGIRKNGVAEHYVLFWIDFSLPDNATTVNYNEVGTLTFNESDILGVDDMACDPRNNNLYIVSLVPGNPSEGSVVYQINPTTLVVLENIALGEYLRGITIDLDGVMYGFDRFQKTLFKYNVSDGFSSLGSFFIPQYEFLDFPLGVSVNFEGHVLLALLNDFSTRRFFRYDPKTDEMTVHREHNLDNVMCSFTCPLYDGPVTTAPLFPMNSRTTQTTTSLPLLTSYISSKNDIASTTSTTSRFSASSRNPLINSSTTTTYISTDSHISSSITTSTTTSSITTTATKPTRIPTHSVSITSNTPNPTLISTFISTKSSVHSSSRSSSHSSDVLSESRSTPSSTSRSTSVQTTTNDPPTTSGTNNPSHQVTVNPPETTMGQGESSGMSVSWAFWIIIPLVCVAVCLLVLGLAIAFSKLKRHSSPNSNAETPNYTNPSEMATEIPMQDVPLNAQDSLDEHYKAVSGSDYFSQTPSPTKGSTPTHDKNPDEIAYDEIEMTKELGSGAFGRVFAGIWHAMDVAVKEIKNATITPKELDAFRQEAKLMEKLRPHENVVQFLGMCSDPLCIVTELCEGGSLCDYVLDHSNSLTVAEGVAFLMDIAKGVYHLHMEGLIHKDLALRNVLMVHRKQRLCAKVADFGMSRLVSHDDSGELSWYISSNEKGPLRWMAPESLSSRLFSTKSDVTAIELFQRGERPYPSVPSLDVFVQDWMTLTANAASQIPAHVPADTRSILESCLDMNPNQRPDFKEIVRLFLQMCY